MVASNGSVVPAAATFLPSEFLTRPSQYLDDHESNCCNCTRSDLIPMSEGSLDAYFGCQKIRTSITRHTDTPTRACLSDFWFHRFFLFFTSQKKLKHFLANARLIQASHNIKKLRKKDESLCVT